MEQFKLGKIVSAVGLKGEFKVYPYTDYKERFEEMKELYIEKDLHIIEKVRYSGQLVILKIQGIDDRTSAEKMRGKYLLIDRENARKLPDDSYYIADLIGLAAVDENGAAIGTVSDVIQNPAHDIYEILAADGRKILVPAVDEFVLNVDLEGGFIVLHLIEGML